MSGPPDACDLCGDLDALLNARGHRPHAAPFCTKCGRRLAARESERVEPLRASLAQRQAAPRQHTGVAPLPSPRGRGGR